MIMMFHRLAGLGIVPSWQFNADPAINAKLAMLSTPFPAGMTQSSLQGLGAQGGTCENCTSCPGCCPECVSAHSGVFATGAQSAKVRSSMQYAHMLQGLGSLGDVSIPCTSIPIGVPMQPGINCTLIPCSTVPPIVAQNPGVNCVDDRWYAFFLTPTGMIVGGIAALAGYHFFFHKDKK